MATFTSLDGKQVLTSLTLRTNGQKRVRLALTAEEKRAAPKAADLPILSTDAGVITAQTGALFNGPKGIWTVDLKSANPGCASLNVACAQIPIASLPVTVVPRTVLPPEATEAGILVRLFLSETRNPGSTHAYNFQDAEKGMQWIRRVIVNRLNNNPDQFAAPGAKSIADIIQARRQFQGFENYPTLGVDQQSLISGIVDIANNDNHPAQTDYADFLNAAMEAATGPLIPDPTGENSFLAGWMTIGSDPRGKYVKFSDPIMDNQFFSLAK